MNKILDKDANMLPGPCSSGQADDRENEINAVNEEELLYSEDELVSGQRPPTHKRPSETYSPKVTSKRTRYDDSTIALKKKIEKSKDYIQKLKAYTEKKTCPKSLRYNVRANFVPDEDFKQDINHIRKDAEQKLIGALTRFHYRKIERIKNKLRKTEQKMNLAKARKTDNEKLIKNRPRPARHNKPKARSENVITLANTLM